MLISLFAPFDRDKAEGQAQAHNGAAPHQKPSVKRWRANDEELEPARPVCVTL